MSKELSWKDDGRFPIVIVVVGVIFVSILTGFGLPEPSERILTEKEQRRAEERQAVYEMKQWVKFLPAKEIKKAKAKWKEDKRVKDTINQINADSRDYKNRMGINDTKAKSVKENGEIPGYSACVKEEREMNKTWSVEKVAKFCCSEVSGTLSSGAVGLPTCRK